MSRLASNRVVDAHATKLVSGYRVPQFTGINKIIPIVEVAAEVGKFMRFFADVAMIRQGLERALGDVRKRFNLKVATTSYSTTEVSAEVPVVDRELKAVPEARKQDYYDAKAEFVQRIHLLGMEYTVAQWLKTFTNFHSSVYFPVSGTDQWSDPASKPYAFLREIVRCAEARLGIPTNELSIAMAPNPWAALQDHADTEKKLTAAGGDLTRQRLANWLEVKEIAPLAGLYATDLNENDPDDVLFTHLFSDEIYVYHEVAEASIARTEPLQGCVARLEGSPLVTYYREEQSSSEIIANDDNWGLAMFSDKKIVAASTVSGL